MQSDGFVLESVRQVKQRERSTEASPTGSECRRNEAHKITRVLVALITRGLSGFASALIAEGKQSKCMGKHRANPRMLSLCPCFSSKVTPQTTINATGTNHDLSTRSPDALDCVRLNHFDCSHLGRKYLSLAQ